MDFISIREFRTQSGKIWEKLAQAPMLQGGA